MTTQLEQDAKNARVFAIIAIAGFVLLHILAIVIPAHPFAHIKASPALAIVPIAAVIWLVVCIKSVMASTLFFEESNVPYIALLILSFASAVIIGYCPTC